MRVSKQRRDQAGERPAGVRAHDDGAGSDYLEIDAMDSETKRAVEAFLKVVSDRYDIAGAVLFGSRARQTHRPDSDADVAVILRGTPGNFLATKLELADLAYDVLLDTGIRVQPFPIWEGEWACPDSYPSSRLLRNIVREGVRL
jgi:antitoxin ChpS